VKWLKLFFSYGVQHYLSDKKQAVIQLFVLPLAVPVAILVLGILFGMMSMSRAQINNDHSAGFNPIVGIYLPVEQAQYQEALTQGVATKYRTQALYYDDLNTLKTALEDKTLHVGLSFSALQPIKAEIWLDNRHFDALRPAITQFTTGFDDMLLPLREALAGGEQALNSDAFVIATVTTTKLGAISSLYLPLVVTGLIFMALVYAMDIAKLMLFRLVGHDPDSDEINHFMSIGWSATRILLSRVTASLSVLVMSISAIYIVVMMYLWGYRALLNTKIGEQLRQAPQMSDATLGYMQFLDNLTIGQYVALWVIMVIGAWSLVLINLLVLSIVKKHETAITISNMLNLLVYMAPMLGLLLGNSVPQYVFSLPVLSVFFSMKQALFTPDTTLLGVYAVSNVLWAAVLLGVCVPLFKRNMVQRGSKRQECASLCVI
jgi:hypothetical protein